MPERKNARAGDVRKYCSAACRSQKLQPEDHALEETLLRLLAAGGRRTVCPSEVALLVLGAAGTTPQGAERARRAARRLVAAGKVDIVQHGHVVDPSTAKGPISVRLRR